jgi:glycosyltransferase involved in cell wall biosynthesis
VEVGRGRALRVLFVTLQGVQAPGPRYRVFQYLPRFEALGIEPTVAVMQGEGSTRRSIDAPNAASLLRASHQAAVWVRIQAFVARVMRRRRQFDRVYMYRVPVPGWAVPALMRDRQRMLFDFDDALDRPELDGRWLQRVRAGAVRRGFENAVHVCGTTVTSNERNAEVVRALGGHVEVVPTTVDVSRAAVRDRAAAASPPVLGWIGTPSTARYLREIEEPLRRVAAMRPVVLRLTGAGRNPFRDLAVELREWSLDTESADIGGFDIGLMPMPDTAWSSGKAALKALEYSASGAPTVASWTATNQAILGGNNGAILCRNADEWVSALVRLLDDDAERGERGDRARTWVTETYSVDRYAPRLCRVLTGERADPPTTAQERD